MVLQFCGIFNLLLQTLVLSIWSSQSNQNLLKKFENIFFKKFEFANFLQLYFFLFQIFLYSNFKVFLISVSLGKIEAWIVFLILQHIFLL